MNRLRRFLRSLPVLLVPVLLIVVANGPLQGIITEARKKHGLIPRDVLLIQELAPDQGLKFALVGMMSMGFRDVAASLIWLRSDELWHQGQWWKVKSIYRTVTLLDPHFIEAWQMTGWHIAYNLYAEAQSRGDTEAMERCLREGLKALEEGAVFNKDRYDLFYEAGWTCRDKMGDCAKAVYWMSGALGKKGAPPDDAPSYVNFVRHQVAHSYERLTDVPKMLAIWEEDLRREPKCHTALGATITIKERYVVPWELMLEGRYDEASAMIEDLMDKMPSNSIARHMLAEIYRYKAYHAYHDGDESTAKESLDRVESIMLLWADTNKMDDIAKFKVKMMRNKDEEGNVDPLWAVLICSKSNKTTSAGCPESLLEPRIMKLYEVPSDSCGLH